jgi:hypothetical protein
MRSCELTLANRLFQSLITACAVKQRQPSMPRNFPAMKSTPKSKAKTKSRAHRSQAHPLVGKHFHTVRDMKVNYQGRVLDYLGEGRFIVTLYEWMTSNQNYGYYIFELQSFTWDEENRSGTVFYDSAREMNEAYENRWKRFNEQGG